MKNNHWSPGSLSLIALLLMAGNIANAGIIAVAEGYETSYGINMNPGSSNGSDVEGVFIFEWSDDNYSAYSAGVIAGRGNTYLSHVIDFMPTSALILGYGEGIPGVGDGIDHLYTVTSLAFSYTVGGLKWSEAFPGVPPEPRIGHNAMVDLLKEAEAGLSSAMTSLNNWVMTEGYRAAFDPRGGFAVLEWTVCPEGEEPSDGVCVPVGGPIPEPGTWLLLAIGLLGLIATPVTGHRRIQAA